MHEPPPPQDPDSPFAYSMEGFPGKLPGSLVARYWHPGWNSPQALNKFQQEVAGPLRGGQGGCRLIEPPGATGGMPAYFTDIPAPLARRQGEWFFTPAWHIFGSEKASMHAPAVASLAPRPYVGLGPCDARDLGLAEGQAALVKIEGRQHLLPVRVRPLLPRGVSLLPVGLPELPGIVLPAWGSIEPAGLAGAGEQGEGQP